MRLPRQQSGEAGRDILCEGIEDENKISRAEARLCPYIRIPPAGGILRLHAIEINQKPKLLMTDSTTYFD